MLILIVGATGNVGLELMHSALRRGHQVRALGRSAAKLAQNIRDKLEGFVEVSGHDDRAQLDVACTGVDAIICAYKADPVLILDGQLALLRAAERAGVKRFHAASWNLEWDKMALGENESYDAMIMFSRQAVLTSSIKTINVFCGILAKTLFGVPGAGAMEGDSAIWIHKDNGERVANVIGDGNVVTPFSAEADAADFSVAITVADGAEKGGYYRFCSDEFTFHELAKAYEKVRGAKCEVKTIMDRETCEALALKARREAAEAGETHTRWLSYIGLVYGVLFADGTHNPRPIDAAKFPDVPRTTIEEYIRANDWI